MSKLILSSPDNRNRGNFILWKVFLSCASGGRNVPRNGTTDHLGWRPKVGVILDAFLSLKTYFQTVTDPVVSDSNTLWISVHFSYLCLYNATVFLSLYLLTAILASLKCILYTAASVILQKQNQTISFYGLKLSINSENLRKKPWICTLICKANARLRESSLACLLEAVALTKIILTLPSFSAKHPSPLDIMLSTFLIISLPAEYQLRIKPLAPCTVTADLV